MTQAVGGTGYVFVNGKPFASLIKFIQPVVGSDPEYTGTVFKKAPNILIA